MDPGALLGVDGAQAGRYYLDIAWVASLS